MNPQRLSEPSLSLERTHKRLSHFDQDYRDNESYNNAGGSWVGADSQGYKRRASDFVNLCSTCASTNIAEKIKTIPKRKEKPLLTFENRHLPKFDNPSCPLCSIFAWMCKAIPTDDGSLEKSALVIASSSGPSRGFNWFFNETFGSWDKNSIYLILCPWPPGEYEITIYQRVALVTSSQSLPRDTQLRRPISVDSLDYTRIEKWLSDCESVGHEHCRPPGNRPQGPSNLIDCWTPELKVVVAEPWYDYFALSYVWGRPDFVPEPVPATIRDAAEVTRRLRYRYLWVDRYCIDQNDLVDKQRQIEQMGRIYNHATLTIIAAAGSTPDHGLPGVSKKRDNEDVPPRSTYMDWTIDGYPVDARTIIKQSVWMSRGWTYQEALLSRRRLIFTDQQVYFECQKLMRDDSYVDNGITTACELKSIFHKEEFGKRPEEVFKYISEYSERNLTKPGDYLSGFLGILVSLAEFKHAIYHLFGVPIFPPVIINRNTSIRRINRGYGCRLMIGMNWIAENGTRRREQGFPSWTWVGWSGSVKWAWGKSELVDDFRDFISEDSMKLVSNCEAWAESDKGKSFSLQSLCEPPDPSSRVDCSLLKVLHIRSEVFDVKMVYLPGGLGGTSSPEYWMNWESGGRLVHSRVHLFEDLDAEGISQPRRFKVLVTGRDFQGFDYRRNSQGDKGVERTHGKLLREVREGHEVIGHATFSCAELYVSSSSKADDEGELLLPKTVREYVRLV